jgi:hypothetical protein
MRGLIGVVPGQREPDQYQSATPELQQSGFNFVTGVADGTANNSIRSQGFAVGNVISFWR